MTRVPNKRGERESMNLESNGRNSNCDWLERKGGLLIIFLLTTLFLGGIANQVPLALGHAPWVTIQARSLWAPVAGVPPTIDGIIEDSEWQYTNPIRFTLTIAGNPYDGMFYAMNNAYDLYIAVKIADDDFNTVFPNDRVVVVFDNDNDGIADEAGDDSIEQNAAEGGHYIDLYFDATWGTQEDPIRDGRGACTQQGTFNHFELSHPLDSGDAGHDFSLAPSSTVGFTVAYEDGPVGAGFWPGPRADAPLWGDIVIASSPPSMTAWSPAPPNINGVMEPGEWIGASHSSIAIGWTFSGDVWIMNDASDLYLAVKLADSALADPDQVWIIFDNNNDGTAGTDEEILVSSAAEPFMDGFWDGNRGGKDTDFGGSQNGEGGASNAGGFNYFELKHPLNSGTTHDFSLSGGSTVGFVVGYLTTVTDTYVGYWPECPPTPLAKNWAHYTVAVLAPANNPPNAPQNPEFVATPTPTFSWTFSDPNAGDTQGAYQIQVSTGPDGTGTMTWDTAKTPGAVSSVAYGGSTALSESVTYHWRVKTWDSGDLEGPWCSDQTFMIPPAGMNPPNAPVNPLCEGETNPTDLTTLTPTFSWTFSDPDPGDTQGAYQIQVTTGADGTGTLTWDTDKMMGDSASVAYGAAGTAAALANDVTYHWRVKTWDNNDLAGPWCTDQTFMIPSVTPTQYTLTLVANPPNGGTVQANPPSGPYDPGEQVTIEATPASGYTFSSWTGSGLGSYDGTSRTATVTMNGDITETANFAQCGACATCAAYGSPAAPEVLYMRHVRDQQIGSTSTGGILRDGWNTFYYTWSPPIARAIADNEPLRRVFRGLFTPLLGIVYLAGATFTALSWAGDIASIVAFLVAATLSVAVYMIMPALAIGTALKRRRRKR